MPKDKPLRLERRGVVLLICAVFLTATWAMARSPDLVERMYARRVGFYTARALSVVTGVVPASLAEVALAGATLYVLVPFVIAVVHVVRRKRGVRNALAGGCLRISVATAVVGSLFYFTWGLNYSRAPLATRLGWPPIGRPTSETENRRLTEEIGTIARQLVEATNEAYREFAGSDDLGYSSNRPVGSAGLDAVLDTAFTRVQQRLALEPAMAAARGRAKPLVASLLLNHLGISGFYFPWTGEANYNRLQPAPDLAHSVAHEKSHQRGIALEDEANFVGYLVCVASDDAYVRYSGYLFAQWQLLNELAGRDAARARELIALRVGGVQRDVDFIRAFWRQYDGTASRVSQVVNDRYLRSQGVRRGLSSYAASRSLIIMFARTNGGSARLDLHR
jgi:hypothetical protein